MIPIFPNSKKIELSDRTNIEHIVNKFLPYSDFNFTSMWSWDTHNKMSISKLRNNLVVRFTDYQTGEKFYSFLGNKDLSDTASTLIDLSKKQGLTPKLRLIPKESIADLDPSIFKVSEDRDHFDYIYDLTEMTSYKGNILNKHKRFSKKFLENHTDIIVKEIDIINKSIQNDIISIVKLWADNKVSEKKDVNPTHELQALHRVFKLAESDNAVLGLGIFKGGSMIAFAIDELLYSGMAVNHFMKADTFKYRGIFSYLMQQNALFLLGKHRTHLNFEQDLGLSGLRQAKRSFKPIYYLQKYIVELK